MTILNEAMMRLMKVLDIGYVTFIYVVVGFLIIIPIDKSIGTFDPKPYDKMNWFRVFMEVFGQLWMVTVIVYIVRNLVVYIPSPFHNQFGYNHQLLKEMNGAFTLSIIVIWNSHNLIAKMQYLYTRLTFLYPKHENKNLKK